MSMSGDISCDGGTVGRCLANARVVKVLAKKFGIGQWSFIGPGSEKKWYSGEDNSPQGAWDHIADEMLLEFAKSGHPIFRATTPLSRGTLKSKGHGKLSIHFTADYPTIETIFRIIVSATQLSLYGAVANICEEFEAHQDRSGEPDVLMGQSIVLSKIKAEVPLQNENSLNHQILWQQYEERIKSLSQESKVRKFCMEAGFVHVVEVGQYFMTKDTGDFGQFRAVACREYTLHRDDESSQPRGWIQGNTRIGLVLEVTTSYMYGKHGIEIRIWSLSQDNSHSWVRISYGTNKYVVDSNYNNTEVPANLPEEQASQSSVKVIAARSKAKSKPHFTADYPTIETVFRIILSVNQLSVYGAVAAICEEFESHQDKSGEPDVLMGQSIVLSEIKAEIPLQNENSLNHQILWQQYEERIESLSPESNVSRFCMEAGFIRVVEVGQYFMTKDTGDFRQFRSVACREFSLPRDDPASQLKGWIQGNMRIGPVLEVTTSCQYGKHGIEIRIWSVGQDNSQSWVRISYGTNKYVIDSNHNNTEAPADPHEEQASQTSVKVIAARSKAKATKSRRK